MSDIFLKLLNMSFAAGWLIGAVMILRLVARNVARWNICLLWGMVAIRLSCPVLIESPFSLVPSGELLQHSILEASNPTFDVATGIRVVDESVNEYLEDAYFEGVTVPANYGANVMSVASAIWLIGLFLMVFYAVVMNLWLIGHLKEAVRLRDKIHLCDYVRSPFVFGLFNPQIYLPSGISETDMEYVIAHEEAHLQRKDHIWKAIAFVLLGIYWFNPLSWIAFTLFSGDTELACDERVIKNMSMAEKKAYAESLLSCSFKKRIAIVFPLTFGEVGVKQRVKSILNYKKPAFGVVASFFLACIVIGGCFLTSPQGQSVKEMIQEDISQAQIQNQRKENELKQLLLDYDEEIVEASVALRDSEQGVTSANILIVNRNEVMGMDGQEKIMSFVSEYLGLDASNINLMYMESGTVSIQSDN